MGRHIGRASKITVTLFYVYIHIYSLLHTYMYVYIYMKRVGKRGNAYTYVSFSIPSFHIMCAYFTIKILHIFNLKYYTLLNKYEVKLMVSL